MKLLLDENLSFRLARSLAADFPDTAHLSQTGLLGAADLVIWEYAREHGYVIVTKDDDFRSLSLVKGAPPKVIWLRVGNAATNTITNLLRTHRAECEAFVSSLEEALLVLTK